MKSAFKLNLFLIKAKELMSQIISLLPILSKVVHEQTTTFLSDNNIFYIYQSGFRSNHSTKLFLSFFMTKF